MEPVKLRSIESYWMKLDGWLLTEAISLLLGCNPHAPQSKETTEKSFEIYHLACAAYRAGKIEKSPGEKSRTKRKVGLFYLDEPDILCLGSEIVPDSFVKWAIEKDFENLPNYFKNYGQPTNIILPAEGKRTTAIGEVLRDVYLKLSDGRKNHISANAVRQYLKKNYSEYDAIISMDNENITWKKVDGESSTMNKVQFEKTLSKIRTGKI